MNEDNKLSLPGSGYDQISKILHAYALCGDKPTALDEVASKAAMNATVVSRNNGFFVSLGLLTGGRAKVLTSAGKELAVALGHDLQEDAAIAWKRAILAAPAAKPIIDMLKIQKFVMIESLPAKIAAALGQPDSPATKTGTNTFIEILRKSGLIKENDGKIALIEERPEERVPANGNDHRVLPLAHDMTPASPAAAVQVSAALLSVPTANAQTRESTGPGMPAIPIHVNIELHLPASAEQSVYDALFKSIREHLFTR